jgi:hypothetical protein
MWTGWRKWWDWRFEDEVKAKAKGDLEERVKRLKVKKLRGCQFSNSTIQHFND